MKNNIRIGEVLKEYGYITDEQIQEALDYQKAHKEEGKLLGEILVEEGFVTERQTLEALGQKLDYDLVDVTTENIDTNAVGRIPKAIADKYNMIAIREEGNVLYVALSNPLQFYGIEDVRQITQKHLVLLLDTKDHISRAISDNYSEVNARKALEKIGTITSKMNIEVPAEIEDVGSDAPVVAALNKLLLHGHSMGASDIHIEPFESFMLVRVRMDGVITETARLEVSIQQPLIARIKIMADMDIAERRLPQDGHFKAIMEGREINGRVSIIPTVHGEKAVIRFLYNEVLVDGQEQFGMTPDNYKKFAEIIRSPHGMVYITGPTGSGKTTTLYMVLETLSKKPINICTIEDPVERNLTAINQMQVNQQAGLSFEVGLRALLRQDPDVIMVGETRDAETASIAVRAAITGHLVLSTLHTNNAISAIVRLQDMGIPAYMVANSLAGLVAQRLVRKVCPKCGEEYAATVDECELLGVSQAKIKKGRGCSYCNETGYKGRIAVHEVVVIDKEIRRLIAGGAGVEEIEQALRQEGRFASLQEEARRLVMEGITSMEEYNKVAHNVD
ncbi:MAG: ATPase, T2SS/T4P/T4SS family [Anaerovoracaceae bacterium]